MKSMKKSIKMTWILAVGMALPMVAIAEGGSDRAGNGGDRCALEFRVAADRIYQLLRTDGGKTFPNVDLEKLKQAIRETDVVCIDGPLHVGTERKDAVNYPALGRIEVDRGRWNETAGKEWTQLPIVFHEYLGILGADLGNRYNVSSLLALKLIKAPIGDSFAALAGNHRYQTANSAVCDVVPFKDPVTRRIYIQFIPRSKMNGFGRCSAEGDTMIFSCLGDPTGSQCKAIHTGDSEYDSMTVIPDGNFILNTKAGSESQSLKFHNLGYGGVEAQTQPLPGDGDREDFFNTLEGQANYATRSYGVCRLHLEKDPSIRTIYLEFSGCRAAGELMIFRCAQDRWTDCKVINASGTHYYSLDVIPKLGFMLRSHTGTRSLSYFRSY